MDSVYSGACIKDHPCTKTTCSISSKWSLLNHPLCQHNCSKAPLYKEHLSLKTTFTGPSLGWYLHTVQILLYLFLKIQLLATYNTRCRCKQSLLHFCWYALYPVDYWIELICKCRPCEWTSWMDLYMHSRGVNQEPLSRAPLVHPSNLPHTAESKSTGYSQVSWTPSKQFFQTITIILILL